MSIDSANFFWYGTSLSLQEYVCIASFVQKGFKVRVYSYGELDLPEGAVLADAAEILPNTDLGKYTHAGMPANITAFSDAFRYNLLKRNGGWWFDADVFCLANADKFSEIIKNKSRNISVGFESLNYINNAVLYFDDEQLLNKIILELENAGTEFGWGAIGPRLITRVIDELKLNEFVDPAGFFYSIHYDDLRRMYDPSSLEWCKAVSANSYTLHLWNEYIKVYKIPKNFIPPAGSYLYGLYLENCPQLAGLPALPFETVDVLFDHVDMRDEYKRLVGFEQKIKNNLMVKKMLDLRKKLKGM